MHEGKNCGEYLCDEDAFRSCCHSFKKNPTVVVDWLHPRHYAMLSDDSISMLLYIARVMICIGVSPEQLDLLLMSLIPKPTGGVRPVGVYATFIRIISKLIRKRRVSVAISTRHHNDSSIQPYRIECVCESCVCRVRGVRNRT